MIIGVMVSCFPKFLVIDNRIKQRRKFIDSLKKSKIFFKKVSLTSFLILKKQFIINTL